MKSNRPEFFWFIPSYGDSRLPGAGRFNRRPDFDYLSTIAQAIDHLGFAGALLPTGGCDDAWIIGSALAQCTRNLKFLVAVRPGTIVPVVAARMAASFQRIANGRLALNIIPGDNHALHEEGIEEFNANRYELASEWMGCLKGLLGGERLSHQGRFVRLNNVGMDVMPWTGTPPELHFGGSSPQALEIAARYSDVYLSWGEPPAQIAEKFAAVSRLAGEYGRTLRFGVRMHIVVRETDDEAVRAAETLLQGVSEEKIQAVQRTIASSDSIGRQRMRELHGGDRNRLWVHPGIWAGIGLIRGGAGTALVGSPATIQKVLQEYQALGVDTFILSGYPHLEEAHHVAEMLFPIMEPQTIGA